MKQHAVDTSQQLQEGALLCSTDVSFAMHHCLETRPLGIPAAERLSSMAMPTIIRLHCALQTVPEAPSEIDEIPVASVRQKNPQGYKVFASPATKHLAKENNINLALVNGTGPDGRITRGQQSPLLQLLI